MASGQGFFDRDPVPADGGAAGGDTVRLRLPLPGAPAQLLPLQALATPPPLRRFLGAPIPPFTRHDSTCVARGYLQRS